MEFTGTKNIYLQIADLMLEKIIKEQWKEGERIVSVRELAGGLEVNPNTAMRAYAYLQSEELIYNKRGVGYFVKEGARTKANTILLEGFIENELSNFIRQAKAMNLSTDKLISLIKDRY